ncbi:hypothetical protein [Burkholderia ubonensis]|uniref:hypothetical protein n=1 Tax=Burkholderia ubonensis TaxID=101571 RepID=UPI000A5F8DF3|nr:hypothetical protein [Burkholderia ubonensis]
MHSLNLDWDRAVIGRWGGLLFVVLFGALFLSCAELSAATLNSSTIEEHASQSDAPKIDRDSFVFLRKLEYLSGIGAAPTDADLAEWQQAIKNMSESQRNEASSQAAMLFIVEYPKIVDADEKAYMENKTQFSPKDSVKPVGDCQSDFVGTFGVPKNPPFHSIVRDGWRYLAPGYVAGKPAFTIRREGGRFVKIGEVSGQSADLAVSGYANTDGTEAFFKCAATLSKRAQLVTVDFNLTDDEIRKSKSSVVGMLRGLTFPSRNYPRAGDLNGIKYLLIVRGEGGGSEIQAVLPMWRRN